MPIIEIVLRQLARHGFEHATLAIGHLGALIEEAVGDGSRFGLNVDYAREVEPLGTIGPVIAMLDRLPEHFLVLNGDILTDLDYGVFLQDHVASGAPLTVATYRRTVEVDFGVLDVEGTRVIGFQEKPTLAYLVSMGVYGLTRSTLSAYQVGQPFGFDDLVLDLLRGDHSPRALHYDGYWLDIGRPEDYERANRDFAELRHVLLPPD